ncbi:molybdenum cofactor guanylyltransferase MobA [Salinisphaera sp.]|uniref:molybdenum cofactor guanylyltransferase MobA n=1 Tax=Salinisphaera sp. TaxID=1914330 RepID=UPI002D77A03A|nr:molybdenum cofactor guanylyltransferase MobA [Salinisphaera sp.]HET7312775.1 molybdenum cofactor guanylyltransferase MobA [Salinisphaera sp.]
MKISSAQVTAGILAGGEGRRLGGADKGWYEVAGRPLIEHTLARVRPQAGGIVISANRSLSRYRSLGYTVHGDDTDEYRGPLAGIASMLEVAVTPYVLIVPVDTPMLPLDLVARLADAMKPNIDLAVARTPDSLHPLHALMRRSLLGDVRAALFFGRRRVTEWQQQTARVPVDWPDGEDFVNINRAQDAEALVDRL